MANPLGLWHRLLLPFYSPRTIAKLLSRRPPIVAAEVLETLAASRCYRVVKQMPEEYKAKVLYSMGKFLKVLLAQFPSEELAALFLKIRPMLAQRISKQLTEDKLISLLDHWDDPSLYSVFTKLNSEKTALLLSQFDVPKQIKIMSSLPVWVQAPLIANSDPELRSDLLDKLSLEAAVDLISRWEFTLQSDVLLLLSKRRKVEIFKSLRPQEIAKIMIPWPQEIILEVLNEFDKEEMVHILFNLTDEIKEDIFTILLPETQFFIVTNLTAEQAIQFLLFLEDKEIMEYMHKMDEATQKLLRVRLRALGRNVF